MKYSYLFFIIFSLISLFGNSQNLLMPVAGNTWRAPAGKSGGNISDAGIINWSGSDVSFTTYVRFSKTGKLKLQLSAKADGKSRIRISGLNQSKNIEITDDIIRDYSVGEWLIKDTGYVAFVIEGLSKTGRNFADISTFILSGEAVDEQTKFVKNNDGNFYYWGRRGPSVHLNYPIPDDTRAEWFYNELTVPNGEDIVGSYFMANGFGEGYFGIQVNSVSERRILFSVWSPFSTDDPKTIPDDQKIKLLKKGNDVYTGEFGNEGSGGQSYLKYNWKAGVTYKFLLHGKPAANDHTEYTAYFYAPEKNEWILIASFSRPKTNTSLKRLHSFLENFIPEQGNIPRKVLFGNQWIRDDKGSWKELNTATFTADNTARKEYRMDYAGGLEGNYFYLQNCGFFNHYTSIGSSFQRPSGKRKPPVIAFEKLQ